MKRLALTLTSILCILTVNNLNAQINHFNLDKERSFIKNMGQFDGRNWQKNEIVYGYDQNPFYVFFTQKGLTYRFDKIIKNPRYKKGDPSNPKRINISELIHATWVGANENVEITAEEVVPFHYSYAVRDWPSKDVINIPGIKGYKKITYNNLYDNIDVEYVIHPDGGIKYSIILHPGADPSQIKLEYSSGHTNTKDENISIELNENGQMDIQTSLGQVIENEPYTFEALTKAEISSHYKFENNILTFELGQYDNTKEVIIDPWVLSPNFNSSTAVWEVETDGAGNSYVIGGETPMELRKYNAAGAQQWIYVTPWDTNSVWLGTLATDDVGTSFITSGTSPEIERVDNTGSMVWHNNGNGVNEYWSITFNCDNTKLLVGGTYVPGIFSFDYMSAIFDIDINNGSVNNFVTMDTTNIGGFGATPVEVRSISSSKNAKYIYLTHHDVGAINQNIGACPTDLPVYQVNNNHNLAYKCENYLPETQNGGGLKALVANDQYFYTHDGDQIYQRNLADGTLINTVALPGGAAATDLFGDIVVHCSGLDVDDCGNVYAGSSDRVVKFDANLNFISQSTTNFAVYDVSVNSNGEVLAVGAEFNNSNVNRVGHVASLSMGACSQYALVCCDANICIPNTVCESDPAFDLIPTTGGGTFSGTGITDPNNGTFDPAVSGSGTFQVTYTLACGSDAISVTVDPCVNLTACQEANGDITITNGDGNNTWEEWTTINTQSNDCATCGGVLIFGICSVPLPCTITTTGWSTFATGTITETPTGNWPIQVTDGTGATITIDSLNQLAACAVGCDPTITAAGPFCQTDPSVNLTAVDPGGTWSGTGITDPNLGTFDPATAGPGSHTITYSLACGSSDTETIQVNATDDPSFSYAQAIYCTTDTDPVPTITGLSGGTFSINNGGVINASTGVIDLDVSGANSYVVTYLTNGPCPTSGTFNLTINTTSNATITPAGPFCETDPSVNLTAVDGGGTWSGTGITDPNLGTFDPLTAGVGTHTITYTISGSCGDTDTETITVNATDDASFSYAQGSYCLTDPNPTPTVTGLPGGTFTIDGTGVINASTGEINIASSGAGSYTVTYQTNGPCPTTATFGITLTNGANATITPAGPFCETDPSVNLTAVDGGGTWSGTGITDPNLGTFDPLTAGVGTHTITYTISGSCGDTDTETITVNATDDASFNYVQSTFCVTDTDPNPTITGLSGGTFTIDGTGVINASTGVVDLDASGVGSYNVTYQTNGPCPSSTTVALSIVNTMDATITAAGPFCENDLPLNLTAADPGGTWSGTGITDPNLGTFDPSVAGAGTHTITYTISGACGDTDTEIITVNPAENATISYSASVYCLDDSDPTAVITGTMGGTFTIDNGGVINSSTGQIDLGASGAGSYTVTYTTSGACPAVGTFTVTISNSTSAAINPAGPFCVTDDSTLLVASTPGGTWTGTGITDGATGNFDPGTAGPGIHQIIYTLTGTCSDADTIDIEVYGQPTVTTDGPFTISWGSSVQITASGGTNYSWSPDADLSCSNCPDPIASPLSTTTYCVTAYNGTCSDTACTIVTVDLDCGEVYVPTAFTPSSGDDNAMECVLGGCIVDMHFRIYDRWGELIFECFDQNICWDGTHKRNGKMMSTGVYVYVLDATLADGQQINKKGNISLIR
ncbi:MAG: gliding motility-associated C-terminal domain-containing protein [Crocinitomicaceae bacterium]|nr:gliding motility-associated C-terminal domain-containing protein [Crocinitomicaceae bacterium]